MSADVVKVCAKCGSSAVTRDALVGWDIEAQDWTVITVFDNANCEMCGNNGNNVLVDKEITT